MITMTSAAEEEMPHDASIGKTSAIDVILASFAKSYTSRLSFQTIDRSVDLSIGKQLLDGHTVLYDSIARLSGSIENDC